MAEPFDPTRYLIKLKGAEYLEVKYRLVWLRDRHPDAQIRTEIYYLDDTKAVVSADIIIPDGGRATGLGSETPGDFRDYLEKAETKAIGRALAALGFGTQFAPDHDFAGGTERVVDAPVSRPPSRPTPQPKTTVNGQPVGAPTGAAPQAKASTAKLNSIAATAKLHGVTPEQLRTAIRADYGVESSIQLTEAQADDLLSRVGALA